MKSKKKNRNTILIVVTTLLIMVVVSTIYFMGIKNGYNEEELYIDLPAEPEDFAVFKRDIEKSYLNDLCPLYEGYWKSPNLYPTWDRAKISYYENHDYSRWGVHGYGAYPGSSGIRLGNMKEGESFEFCTFFKTSYGIETYQGIRLIPIENEYFRVEISPQDFPEYENHYLLEPTFPIFSENWVKRIKVKVIAKQDIPKGTYYSGFNVGFPDDRFNNKMIWEVLMGDTDMDYDYVKKCVDYISSHDKFPEKMADECERFMMQRQKKYITGGGYGISRNTYTITIIAE